MRAWKDAAPTEPAPRLAEAQLYLRLDAPAAAIASADAGLVLLNDTNRALERPLLALKAHAHAAVGEPAPAWAAYTRLLATAPASGSTTQSDPDADLLFATARRARWAAFAQLASTDAQNRLLNRLIAAANEPSAPAAAHLRLARWFNFIDQPAAATTALQNGLAAHPTSRELAATFARRVLTDAVLRFSGRHPDHERSRPALAHLAANPAMDPFTYSSAPREGSDGAGSSLPELLSANKNARAFAWAF